MYVPRQNPNRYQHQESVLNPTFSLLCWNVHKENTSPYFYHILNELLDIYPSDFLLFQEYKITKHQVHGLGDFSYATAANIETKRNLYGLITASKCGFKERHIELTRHKEFFISTRKSLLLTRHSQHNGKPIYLVNIHAINFVSFNIFLKELKKIESLLKIYSGAMIVSGDFNNWSKKRTEALKVFQNSLALEKAVVEDKHHIKQIFSKPVDHIYYRDLVFNKAEAVNTKKTSDHNPIYATFSSI